MGQQSASTVVGALVQGVRWEGNLRAWSSALSVQGLQKRMNVIYHTS